MKRTFQNTPPRSFSPVTLICPMVVGGFCNLIWKKLPQEFCLIISGWEPARISYICYILYSILLTSLVQAFDFSGTLCWSLTFVILCSGCLTLFPDPASDGSTAVPSLTPVFPQLLPQGRWAFRLGSLVAVFCPQYKNNLFSLSVFSPLGF